MASSFDLSSFLGHPCTWLSTTTGKRREGYVVAVRLDERVQVSRDR